MRTTTRHCRFQSTPSARRATDEYYQKHKNEIWISIHALREEGDHTDYR